jgi:hypothetical protein
MVFSLGLGVIYLFNLYSTVPSYFGYLKKISPQALTALPRRAASGSELPHVVIFRLFPSRKFVNKILRRGVLGTL